MKLVTRGEHIILKLNPLESVLSLKREIEIPREAIKSIKTGDARPGLAIRSPGTWIPGLLRAGTYRRRENGKWIKEFWFRLAWGKPITIELKNHTYKRIVIKIKNSERLKEELLKSLGL